MLAGLVKSPVAYAPTDEPRARDSSPQSRAPDHARQRRYRSPGCGSVRAARTSSCATRFGRAVPRGQYFQEQLRQELVERFGWEQVYQRGLRVYSTIDMDLQDAAEAAVAESLKALEDRREALARGAGAPRTIPRRCRLRSSRWIRAPATFARWSADATSRRAVSTARCRRGVSRARRSSRSCTPRRSRPGYTPATILDHLNDDSHAAGRAGRRRTDTDGRVHDAAHGAPDVEQPRRRSPAAAGRHPADRRVRESHGHRRRAQRPVARARIRRGHAAVAHRRVRGIRQPRPGVASDPHQACRRHRRQGSLHQRALFRPRDQRLDGVPDVDDAGGCDQRGTAASARSLGFTLPAGGQDRDDQRLQRRVVRRVHAEPARRRLGGIRSAAHDPAGRFRRRSRRAAVGPLHENGDEGRQAAVARDAAEHHGRQGLPPVRQARDERLRACRGGRRARRSTVSRVLPEYFASGTEPTDTAICTARAASSARSPRSSAASRLPLRTSSSISRSRRLSTRRPPRWRPLPTRSPRNRSAVSGASCSDGRNRSRYPFIAPRPRSPSRGTSRGRRRAGDLPADLPQSRRPCRGWPSPPRKCLRG